MTARRPGCLADDGPLAALAREWGDLGSPQREAELASLVPGSVPGSVLAGRWAAYMETFLLLDDLADGSGAADWHDYAQPGNDKGDVLLMVAGWVDEARTKLASGTAQGRGGGTR